MTAMPRQRSRAAPVLLSLGLAWLAIHAALLGLVLGVKLLGARTLALLLLLAAGVWLLADRRAASLPPPSGVI